MTALSPLFGVYLLVDHAPVFLSAACFFRPDLHLVAYFKSLGLWDSLSTCFTILLRENIFCRWYQLKNRNKFREILTIFSSRFFEGYIFSQVR